MDERIKSIISQMNDASADAVDAFGVLTADQLNWKPSEKGWSVAQCLEHIILTNREFYPEFEKLASGNRKNSVWENLSPLTGWSGRFLIKSVSEDSKKIKAPTARIVPPSDVAGDIVQQFVQHIAEVNQKVEACSRADREKTVVTSPFLFIFTYKLDDAYTVMVEHIRRHIRQAKRVTATAGFPG